MTPRTIFWLHELAAARACLGDACVLGRLTGGLGLLGAQALQLGTLRGLAACLLAGGLLGPELLELRSLGLGEAVVVCHASSVSKGR